MCFSVLGTISKGWNSSFSWAWPEHIPGHWEGLLGLVTSLGSSLNTRHFPWTCGQLGKAPGPWPGWSQLGKAGQGSWACLDLGWTLWHSQNTLTHTPSRIPGLTLKVLFLIVLRLFGLCTFFGNFGTFWLYWHILQFWQSLAPHWPPKCHRASWGSVIRCKARDRAKKSLELQFQVYCCLGIYCTIFPVVSG